MVVGYHAIMTAYGFWLPNDPRGSWSDFVRSWELLRFGKATRIETTRSVAGETHDFALRQAAKQALRYPEVHFSPEQIESIAVGFAEYVQKSGVKIWACSILPEHVHFVIGRHRFNVEQIVNLLKGASTTQLMKDGRHPLAAFAQPGERPPRCWASRGWNVFLDSVENILRSIAYVEANPEKEGRPSQVGSWKFVQPYVPELGDTMARIL